MTDKEYLKLAIDQAKKSVECGGFPAGAVVVKDGKVISTGISVGNKINDPTSHSESVAIREACNILKTTGLSGAVLYSSMRPCLMCFSAANWAGISKIVYACKKTDEMVEKGYYEGRTELEEINENNNHKIKLEFVSDFEPEVLSLIKNWEENL